MLLTEAKFSKQHGNQNGEKNNRKEKDSCTCEGSAFVQLNKCEVLFHVLFLAVLLHSLCIALFFPAMSFLFNFYAMKKTHWPVFEFFTGAFSYWHFILFILRTATFDISCIR